MIQQAWVEMTSRNGIHIVAIHGEVDLSNAASVVETLYQDVPNVSEGVVIDLSGLRYMDSRGIHLLLQILERLNTRRQPVRMVLPEASPLYRVFEILSIATSPGVDPTIEAAVAKLQAHRASAETPQNRDGAEAGR